MSLPSLQTERIESLKAGLVASLTFSLSELGMSWLNTIVLVSQWEQFHYLQVCWGMELFLREAIGGISGFLFGVTYRYIIRGDSNSHLKDGSVLAFGIVRGLALWEGVGLFSEQLEPLIILFGESLFCFALARLVLDLALSHKLIKPYSNYD